MSDARKGPSASPSAPTTPVAGKKAAGTSTPKLKTENEEATIKVASKKDGSRANGVIKLKKPPPKHKQPGNWKEGAFVDQDKKKASKSNIPAPSPSPVVNQLDETARETFATGRPLEDAPDLQMCKHCKKSVLSTAAKQHIAACLKLKKEKAQRKKEAKEKRERAREQQAREQAAREEEEAAARRAENGGDGKNEDSSDSEDGGGGGAGGGSGGAGAGGSAAGGAGATDKKPPKPMTKKAMAAAAAAQRRADAAAAAAAAGGKKRKADGELDKGGAKKKKKEEAKPKAAKPKGPVDVERQCGVILPNGQPCARSLTCKSHSMGAKRAVPGRSLPYDMLLAAYQKKNQAKQQKAAIDASAPLEDDDDANGAAVNSDEETAAVMNALARWRPTPAVEQPGFEPIRRQYQRARLLEQLHTATNGGRVNIFRVNGFGAQKLPAGHPGLQSQPQSQAQSQSQSQIQDEQLLDSEDAPGEPDDTSMMMLPPAAPSATPTTVHHSVTPVLPPVPPRAPSSSASMSSSPPPHASSATATPSMGNSTLRAHNSPSTARPMPVAGRA